MAPRATRSSGKIVIKPRGGTSRGTRSGRASAASTPTRPTIRINPRVAATASRRDDTPDDEASEDEDLELDADVLEDLDAGESTLTSNNGASTSRAQTVEEDIDVREADVKSEVVDGDDVNPDVDVDGDEGNQGEDGDEVGTPQEQDDDGDDEEAEVVPVPRGRGRGRPRGRGRAALSGTSTPRGRPRGRGRGRGRGRPSGRSRRERDEEAEIEYEEDENGNVRQFRQVQGQAYYIEGDEYVVGGNPKGDAKIDANGNLLGGRRFKANTFVLPSRDPERKYMLAIDAARSSGFRDSLYYFRRNPLALKLNASQWEKDYLIEQGKLGSHLRTRSVTLITARSAYKLHGAKMVLDGRWIIDDYNEEKVAEEISAKGISPGDLVGDLQDPALAAEAAALGGSSAKDANKQERSGIGMYRAGGPTTIFGGSGWGPYSDGPLNAVKKSMLNREGVSEENWMHVAAQRTLEMNDEWKSLRQVALGGEGIRQGKEVADAKRPTDDDMDVDVFGTAVKRKKVKENRPAGVYDPQTGLVFYRSDTQPTNARWEYVGTSRPMMAGAKVGSAAWGLAQVDTVMELPAEGQEESIHLEALRLVMGS